MNQRVESWIDTLPSWMRGWAALAVVLGCGLAFMIVLYLVAMIAVYGFNDLG